MLDSFGWRSAGCGDDVARLMEVRTEQRRLPALDRFLKSISQRDGTHIGTVSSDSHQCELRVKRIFVLGADDLVDVPRCRVRRGYLRGSFVNGDVGISGFGHVKSRRQTPGTAADDNYRGIFCNHD